MTLVQRALRARLVGRQPAAALALVYIKLWGLAYSLLWRLTRP